MGRAPASAPAVLLAGGLLPSPPIRTRLALLLALPALSACLPTRIPGDAPYRASESTFLSIVRLDAAEDRDPSDTGIGLRRRLTSRSALSLEAQQGGVSEASTVGVALAVHYAF